MSEVLNQEAGRIAELNDKFRRTFAGGKVVMTPGIADLAPDDLVQVLAKVRGFEDFEEGDDPYGEHDFGAFDHSGQKIFWKIDYYAPCMTRGSEDPADPSQTTRVLTVLLAEEY